MRPGQIRPIRVGFSFGNKPGFGFNGTSILLLSGAIHCFLVPWSLDLDASQPF